jgi:hypothetical protein
MIIGPSKSRTEGNATIVSALIETGSASFELQYTLPSGSFTEQADPFIAAALLPAMMLGQPLQVGGTASPQLLRAIPTIQQIFHCWDSHLQLVPVQVETESIAQHAGTRGVACFFSGGVDSFYTALKHLDEIDALIFVHGFDIALEDQEIQEEVARSLGEAAAELGKPLIQVRTNIRALLRRHVSWDWAFGPAAASVALVLAPFFRQVYIASSYSYADLLPCGSHPLVDPLWSTEEMKLVHDGCEANRVQKVAHIATCDTALRHLRVCPNNRGAVMNCGRCRKCVSVMIRLQLAGALERCPTFAQPLDLDAVEQMDLTPLNGRQPFINEMLEALEDQGREPALARALRIALDHDQSLSIERQQRELAQLAEVLASTQAWARELEAAAIARDRDLERMNRALPVQLARRVRRLRSRR